MQNEPDCRCVMMPNVTISIVSHRQFALVAELLADIEHYCKQDVAEVILTLNLPEDLPLPEHGYSFPLRIINNKQPLGFGENHNQALADGGGEYFCVLNPDIRICANVFEPLIDVFQDNPRIGLVAPRIINAEGDDEDSARHFPTPWEIMGKLVGLGSRRSGLDARPIGFPDWVAGMFMLIPASVFRMVGGFDTRYFLYYEDVDLCARLRLRDYDIAVCRDATVIHNARRSSHRNLKYLRWHATSMLRFFTSRTYREIRTVSKV